MPSRYAQLFFGPSTQARQEAVNSHISYANGGEHDDGGPMPLGPAQVGLVSNQRHFFLATVTPSGWPYIQHRGGPTGFVHALDASSLAFADFDGNEQFVSTGNIDADGRVAMFFVDYPTRTRLKIFGRAWVIDADTDAALHARVMTGAEGAIKSPSTRTIIVDVEAWDMNCRKYIQPRYDRAAVDAMIAPYRDDLVAAKARIAELEAQLAAG